MKGFLLDPAEILPTCRETLEALSTLVRYAGDPGFALAQDKPTGANRRTAVYAVVGALAGVVVLVVVIGITVYYCVRKKQRESS